MNKTAKIITIAIVAIVFVILATYVYRLFFMFKKDKIKAYATAQANGTASPEIAFRLLIEGCEHILKSADLTKQVKLLALVDQIEIEKALVLTALNNCYASGFIGRPEVEAKEMEA